MNRNDVFSTKGLVYFQKMNVIIRAELRNLQGNEKIVRVGMHLLGNDLVHGKPEMANRMKMKYVCQK